MLGQKGDLDINSVWTRYQTALIIKCVMLKFPALAGIVLFLQNGNKVGFVMPLTLLIILYSYRPTKRKLIEELQLDYNEQEQLGL